MPRYDLIYILDILRRRLKFILLIAVLAAVGAGAASLLSKPQYRAVTEFFVSSPYISDRNNIYHTSKETPEFISSFATEDDIDKLVGISHTEQSKNLAVQRSMLAAYNHADTANHKQWSKVVNSYYKAFDIKRSEYGLLEISFTHENPQVAANVANVATEVIGEIYSEYHYGLRSDVGESLKVKVHEADSVIAVLTDTLAAMRDRYGIYDILSPTRQTIISGNMRNGGAGFGYAVEQVQNIESIKDQLVIDRSRYQSILNEYTRPAGEANMLKVISPASVPLSPVGPGLVGTIIIAFLAAAALAALWVLLAGYLRLFRAKYAA